jgi:hypothetical protein
MTKKHFIALADAIRNYNDPDNICRRSAQLSDSDGHYFDFTEAQIEALADFCQAQNPDFNRERWLGYIAGTNGKNGGAK